MKKKILASVLAALAVAGALTACGGSSSTPAAPSTSGDGDSSSPEYVWKMALNSTEGDNAYDTAAVFKDKIAELTDGRVQVDLYGGAQLGSTTEVLEGMSVGVADIMCESVGTLAPFTPLANIDIMPYMYTGYDHFMNVWNSDLGDEIKETVGEAAGYKLLGATYRSPRIVTATKEMHTVADFSGFKLRAPNLEGYIKVWQWMGSAPTPLAMNETYTALQQGTVEGQENPIETIVSYGFQNVNKYLVMSNHIIKPAFVMINEEFFQGLSEEYQQLIIDGCAKARDYANDYMETAMEQDLQTCIDAGMTVCEPDLTEWKEATQSVRDDLGTKIWGADGYEEVKAIAAQG